MVTESTSVVAWGQRHKGLTAKERKGVLVNDENVLYLNCSGGYICQNANCTLNMGMVYLT